MILNERILRYIDSAESRLYEAFQRIERIKFINQNKLLDAFHQERIGTHHFQTTTGYGYHDIGREALEKVFANVFHCEAALVRQQLVSGTHAIACALLGNLTYRDELILASGFPYETLMGVLGISSGVLETVSETAGFKVKVIPLTSEGRVDTQRLLAEIGPRTKMIAFQRSCGYADRPSLAIAELEIVFQNLKANHQEIPIFVDNCYGEFVETLEPTEVGADLMAGSLIKNPGGCLIPSGGYIVGTEPLVKKAAERLYAPGIGGEIGPSLLNLQPFFQGFFEAPHRVGDMVKGALLTAQMFAGIDMITSPSPSDLRTDIIQKIYFDTDHDLIEFCRAVQKNSPVESHVRPEPALLPGYIHPVIMGGGTFISGATSEFSADAPITPPFTAFMQGGLSYTQIKLSLARIFQSTYIDQLPQ